MAWTAPMTAVARDVWSSSAWNSNVRDNLLETMPGKATTVGSYFVTTGRNAIAQRAANSQAIATAQTRSNTVYGDLATVGPAATVTTGTEALVWIMCEVASDTNADSPEETVTKTYAATSTATFRSDGTNRNDGTRMYQGQNDSTNGNQYSMALFPYATMASDMANAKINSCELFLANQSFHLVGGGSAIIGTHSQTNLSGSHAYSQVTPDIAEEYWGKGESAFKYTAEEIAERFRDGDATGIALGKGPTTSLNYYGYFAGGTSPKLRISYTSPGSSGGYCKVSFAISGATTIPASDTWSLYFSGATATNQNRWGACHLVTNLTPGSNTFTMKYAAGASGATGTFQRREIIVMPL